MADPAQVRDLETRKRLLLATCGVQRHVIAAQCDDLEARAGWVEHGYAVCQAAAPLWKAAAPAALWVLFRKRRSGSSLVSKAISGIRLAREALGLWRSLKKDGEK